MYVYTYTCTSTLLLYRATVTGLVFSYRLGIGTICRSLNYDGEPLALSVYKRIDAYVHIFIYIYIYSVQAGSSRI